MGIFVLSRTKGSETSRQEKMLALAGLQPGIYKTRPKKQRR